MRCRYCGRSAGWLRDTHPWCERWAAGAVETRRRALRELREAAHDFAFSGTGEREFEDWLRVCTELELSPGAVRAALLGGWEQAAADLLRAEALTRRAEERLWRFAARAGLRAVDLDRAGWATRVRLAATVRRLREGETVGAPVPPADVPIALAAGEGLIWVFDVQYRRPTTDTVVDGTYVGTDLPFLGKTRLQLGKVRLRPVSAEVFAPPEPGALLVTTWRLHYIGASRAFRADHGDLTALFLSELGLMVFAQPLGPRPHLFATGDDDLAYDLIRTLQMRRTGLALGWRGEPSRN